MSPSLPKVYLLLAAISGFIAVGLGAFGAHGLRDKLSANMLAVYQTGVQYQFYHTLALVAVALLLWQMQSSLASSSLGSSSLPSLSLLKWSGNLFAIGIVVFSGSLYILAWSGVRWLGAITPIGGVAFLAGWICLALAAWRWQ
jgi:uncharacterized membrane protein YgdD (TMEM256/DUF423 family)